MRIWAYFTEILQHSCICNCKYKCRYLLILSYKSIKLIKVAKNGMYFYIWKNFIVIWHLHFEIRKESGKNNSKYEKIFIQHWNPKKLTIINICNLILQNVNISANGPKETKSRTSEKFRRKLKSLQQLKATATIGFSLDQLQGIRILTDSD